MLLHYFQRRFSLYSHFFYCCNLFLLKTPWKSSSFLISNFKLLRQTGNLRKLHQFFKEIASPTTVKGQSALALFVSFFYFNILSFDSQRLQAFALNKIKTGALLAMSKELLILSLKSQKINGKNKTKRLTSWKSYTSDQFLIAIRSSNVLALSSAAASYTCWNLSTELSPHPAVRLKLNWEMTSLSFWSSSKPCYTFSYISASCVKPSWASGQL